MSAPPSPQELLRRLIGGSGTNGLCSELLREAEILFQTRGDATRAAWMRCEREGYGARTQAADLHEVLGPQPPQEVVEAVLSCRRQYGRLIVGGVPRHWPHFFVESVDELRQWAERTGRGGALTVTVELDVPEGEPGPHALTFERDVFHRVLESIARELGAALRPAGART
jgi:hypothetical protein